MSIKTFTLKNGTTSIEVTNLGCAIIRLNVLDKNGDTRDIVLGLDKAEDYGTVAHPSFGVVVGRFANRINKGQFTLDGNSYQLDTNDGDNHLHGGNDNFASKVWDVSDASDTSITFTYHSVDGESKYPGDLTATVVYSLSSDNTLRIDYKATTTSKTIANLTNHSYFNLNGHTCPSILNHQLQINAAKTTAISDTLIPTGEFAPVAGTPFDFNTPKLIGKDFDAAGGYDHNYVLDGEGVAAVVSSAESGVKMTVSTNSPGMQLYTSNMMPTGDAAVSGKGVTYLPKSGFCLETQLYPDCINHPHFPSCVVTADSPQRFYTTFKFEVEGK